MTSHTSTLEDINNAQGRSYKIDEVASLAFPHETHPKTFILGNAVGWFFWGCYLLVEAKLIWSSTEVSTSTQLFLWLGWLAECCMCFVDFSWALDALTTMLRPQEQGRRPHYILRGDAAPHVDVFVTTCREPVEVIMNTIRAAATLDYPKTKLSVTLLDDGHDCDLQAAVASMNESSPELVKVFYRSRTIARNTRSFFKAGNLNFGLDETKRLTNGEFVASLDADMIVSRSWLRRLVPHLLLDPKLGMTTSPQNYYNVPTGDPLAQQAEFTIWNTIFEPIHDHVGEAMCMGTGFVVRRAALEQIGGWPLADTGEDYMCSTQLVAKGWRIAYIRENFQHGITPESFQCRVKQRLRWIDAAVEVHRNNHWYLSNSLGDGVTLVDKAASLIFALRDLAAISTLWALITLPVVLLICASHEAISITSSRQHDLVKALLVTAFVSSKVCDWIIYRHAGLGHLSNLQSLDIWAAPYCAIRCIAHLTGKISAANLTFFVTGSFTCPINERNPRQRAPLRQRLSAFGVPIHFFYTILSTIIVVYSTRTYISINNNGSNQEGEVSNIIPAVMPGHIFLLARCTWKMAVPVIYMAFPPSVPEWHTFLQRDEYGVLRPRKPYPSRVRPDQRGGLEMGWTTKMWRDLVEITVLTCLLVGS